MAAAAAATERVSMWWVDMAAAGGKLRGAGGRRLSEAGQASNRAGRKQCNRAVPCELSPSQPFTTLWKTSVLVVEGYALASQL